MVGVSRGTPRHETDDLPLRPPGDTLTRGVVVPVQNTAVRDIDPGMGRVLPACELTADEGLEMAVNDAVSYDPAIRAVTAG